MADEAAVGVMEETEDTTEEEPKPDPEKADAKAESEPEAEPEAEKPEEAEAKDKPKAETKPKPKVADEPKAKDKPAVTSGRRWDPVRVAAIVLVALAGLAAVWSGWSWYGAKQDDALAYSRLRDQVLQSGEQGIQNLTTLDYRTLDASLKLWQSSTTGKMNSDIVQGRTTFEQQVQKAKTVTKSRILEGALTELDDHAGKARVIVAIEIVVTPPTGQPATKRDRYIAELTRTSAGWKVSGMGAAPVGSS